jgi:hypothetical protein
VKRVEGIAALRQTSTSGVVGPNENKQKVQYCFLITADGQRCNRVDEAARSGQF